MGLKWFPVLNVWEQLQDKMKTLSYSYAKYTSRAPLILLTVEKFECENFDFCCCSYLLCFFFSFCITPKVYGVFERSTHQMTALLSKIFLLLVRATCELRSMSYVPKHILQWLCHMPFCVYLYTQTEVMPPNTHHNLFR